VAGVLNVCNAAAHAITLLGERPGLIKRCISSLPFAVGSPPYGRRRVRPVAFR
jgi:hypothetical protein